MDWSEHFYYDESSPSGLRWARVWIETDSDVWLKDAEGVRKLYIGKGLLSGSI